MIEYRIRVDEDSYSYTQDEYDTYAAKVTKHNFKYPDWKTALQDPQTLRETFIQNAWNAILDERYKDIKPAQRYVKKLKECYGYGFLEFYIESAELNWRRV